MKFVNNTGIQLLAVGGIFFSDSIARNKLSIVHNAYGTATNNSMNNFSDTVDQEPCISNDHFYNKMF